MSEFYSQKIIDAKLELNESLKNFTANFKSCKDRNEISALIGEIVNKHSAVLTTVNQALSVVHQQHDFYSEKNLRQEYLGTIKNFIPQSIKVIVIINELAEKKGIQGLKVSMSSYDTIQSFIQTFADEQTKASIKTSFIEKGLPITGFNHQFKKTMKKKYLHLQLWVGIPLLILCGLIILCGEKYLNHRFNGIQLIFLKALLSLSVSAVGSSIIEGTANIDWKMQTALQVRAAGWVAVFLLLYFLNPASPSQVTG